MNKKKLCKITTIEELKKKLTSNKGLFQFAKQRSKFEGWLKVELINILRLKNYDAKPEIDFIDICFENTAIELKTINTNYKFKNVENKHRPITENVNGIIKDIEDLEKKSFENKFVIFIVFPCEKSNEKWQIHLSKIESKLSELVLEEFEFQDKILAIKIPAIIYYGKL
ncbi:MAG: hypothetical protein HN334_02250 [Candidatus Cloacimonetes bacterium]|jgi:hypothetical protein|nr:hypothetical protein [Candidatus Cloacimonadota bacterium]